MIEAVYVPSEPSYVFESIKPGACIKVKLFGVVDDVRKEQELKVAQHRADQLGK
jgi:hypothetical protein